MYDIKIFIEDNGNFGARVNAGKEIIYGVGKNQEDLMENIKTGFELGVKNKTGNPKISSLYNYLNSNNKNQICH